MKHPIKEESNFVKELGRALSSDLTEEEKMILDVRYGLDYGGVANFANVYLGKLIKAIKKHLMSLDGFGPQDDEVFSILLNSDRLDGSLQRELSSLLYDPKMREKYFKWILLFFPIHYCKVYAVGLSDRIFIIRNRKLKVNHYKKSDFYWFWRFDVKKVSYNYIMMSDELCWFS